MKQITNKEYEEWQKYKAEKAKGHILLLDTVRFICEANGYDAEKIGQHFLEILPKICPPEQRYRKTPPSRYGSEASFIEVHWFDPGVQKIHIAYLLFCVKKSRTGNRRLSLPLVRLLFLRTARPPSRGYSIIPAHPRRIVKHGFPPRGIRISDGRSCCDFRPRRQRYPLRSVHSDNPLCVITSSQYMRRSQRSSPLHDP